MDFLGSTTRSTRATALVVAAVGLLFAPVLFAPALSAQSNPAAEEQDQLEDARDERERLAEQLEELTVSDDQLLGYITGLEEELAALEAQAGDALAHADWASHQVELADARLEVARRVAASRRAEFREGAAAMYVGPAPDTLGTRVLGSDAHETERRVVLVGSVLDGQRVTLVELEAAEAALVGEQAVAADVVAMADAAHAEALGAQDRLHRARSDYVEARAELHERIAEVQAEIDELVQAERDLERLIREIQLDAIRNAGTAPDRLFWPSTGWVSSEFGPRWGRNHNGIDLAAITGTEVVAAAGGTVSHAGPFGSFGNLVMIEHGGGLTTLYAHLHDVDVSVGEAVDVGERIGSVGSTGRSTGPHLHFEVRRNGDAIDPRNMLL